ncbi:MULTISPECIES: hypothetical protein [unclassified Bradyrhizobium]|uniref:hypothetical protein n=1 Tax=unclassified Bradyrhizobium TaxID=2631580 RepID=UPI0015CA1574|nr:MULTISPECIES: hypothetical protein [unclassified Bradyrhizobium]MBB4259705.1 hypothetical protein [Bradyrhizobium sp. CIR3A]NYG47595.1 hypothetical protein [Bradyrhizobium sp. IAR9]
MTTATLTAGERLSHLIMSHRTAADLDAAAGIQKEIVDAPAANWAEFGAKACLLINELTTDPTTGWLDAIRESLRADVERLGTPRAA